MKKANVFFTITMPYEWRNVLYDIAKEHDCSMAQLIRKAVKKVYLYNRTDLQDAYSGPSRTPIPIDPEH